MHSFAAVFHLTTILSFAAFSAESQAKDLQPRSVKENQTTNLSDTTLIKTPGRSYVNMTDVLSLFLWEIKGTSLDQLKLDCGGVGTINRTDHVTNGSTTVTLMLTLVDEDHVTCNVTDGGVVLDTRTIDRVQVAEKSVLIYLSAISLTLAVIFLITTIILSIATGQKYCCRKRSKNKENGKVITNKAAKYTNNPEVKTSVEMDGVDAFEDDDYYADNIISDRVRVAAETLCNHEGNKFDNLSSAADVTDEDYYADNIVTDVVPGITQDPVYCNREIYQLQ